MMNRSTRLIWQITDPIQLHKERRRSEVTLSLLQPRRNDVILDVGCGDGYQLSYLTKYTSYIVGVDLSIQKLREGKGRVNEAHFICASSEKLPFQPRTFNKVICLELLEHLKNLSKTISEIDLVLKEAGILIISLPYKEHLIWTRCIHCGKLTPHSGHLHSFDEKRISSILPTNYVILTREYVCTVVSSYMLFSFLPTRLWKILDNFSRMLPEVYAIWFMNKFQKV